MRVNTDSFGEMNGVKSLRAVAQITLASIIHTVYKDGKYNLNGVLP
jgi:hypothetical protein